jgi:AraC family transcriptional regulator, regulatory protein of adaptative response / DNA-3-methyladenine glycosylase II
VPGGSLIYLNAFLGARVVPGVEAIVDGEYRRTVPGPAVLTLASSSPAAVRLRGSAAASAAADEHLRSDPDLGPLVAARPGLRVPGTVDGAELAVRAVLGQQVTLAAARGLAARLVAMAGEPLPGAGADPAGSAGPEPAIGPLTHLWPSPQAVAEAAGSLPMPGARRRAIAGLARELAGGLRLEPGVDPQAARAELLALPGIGPWTAEYVAMRALADPDAWLPTDVGVRHALERLGAPPEAADRWRPFRAHAVIHLWASL